MQTGNESSANATGRIMQFWYGAPGSAGRFYRPAILVECVINFRSIKAGINHSEERTYTAWLPDGNLPVDWDAQAIEHIDVDLLEDRPDPGVAPFAGAVAIDDERIAEIQSDLIGTLVRRERLTILYNPLFQLFSDIDEPTDEFVARAAEAALAEIEPELKKLKHVFDLRLEQVREVQLRRRKEEFEEDEGDPSGGKGEIERLLQRRTEFREAENSLTSLFMGKADYVLALPSLRPRDLQAVPGSTAELHEDLIRLEHEASDALTRLYTRYIEMVRSYDEFEIGIQPNNIRAERCALVWVPVQA